MKWQSTPFTYQGVRSREWIVELGPFVSITLWYAKQKVFYIQVRLHLLWYFPLLYYSNIPCGSTCRELSSAYEALCWYHKNQLFSSWEKRAQRTRARWDLGAKFEFDKILTLSHDSHGGMVPMDKIDNYKHTYFFRFLATAHQ